MHKVLILIAVALLAALGSWWRWGHEVPRPAWMPAQSIRAREDAELRRTSPAAAAALAKPVGPRAYENVPLPAIMRDLSAASGVQVDVMNAEHAGIDFARPLSLRIEDGESLGQVLARLVKLAEGREPLDYTAFGTLILISSQAQVDGLPWNKPIDAGPVLYGRPSPPIARAGWDPAVLALVERLKVELAAVNAREGARPPTLRFAPHGPGRFFVTGRAADVRTLEYLLARALWRRQWAHVLRRGAIAVGSAVLIAAAVMHLDTRRRRRNRTRANRCAQCGYDLRETPDRCPECGGAAAAA